MTRYQVSPRLMALIPQAGERAVRGAELAVAGQVAKLAGAIYLVQGNGDVYMVDLEQGTCTCPDSRAAEVNGVKLCKHVCAAMLIQT
jgi:uncharacterized Zn finger protein